MSVFNLQVTQNAFKLLGKKAFHLPVPLLNIKQIANCPICCMIMMSCLATARPRTTAYYSNVLPQLLKCTVRRVRFLVNDFHRCTGSQLYPRLILFEKVQATLNSFTYVAHHILIWNLSLTSIVLPGTFIQGHLNALVNII